MADLNKIPTGQRIQNFPNRTFNTLIDGEVRDRSRPKDEPAPTTRQHSPVLVRIVWDGDDDVDVGHVVKLGAVLYDPTDEDTEHAPFAGLQFHADEFEADEAIENFAVLLGAIDGGGDGVGYGIMPEAWWAKVDVSSADHTHAKIVTAGTLLESAESDGLRIIWKPTETGEQWCVLELAGRGGGSVSIRQGFIVGKVDEDTEFEGWTWEKEDGKRWFKPPARDLKDPPPEDEEEDPYHPYWSVEVHLCAEDDEGRLVQQYTEQPLEGEEEEEDPETEMVPVTTRAKRINADKLTLPKSAKEMTHDWNHVSDSWVAKPPEEVEVYAFPCEILAGRVYIDQCNMVRVLKEPPEPPEEEP